MAAQPIPRDARLVALIASSMGIQDYESAALVQLLDFAQRETHACSRLCRRTSLLTSTPQDTRMMFFKMP